MKHILLCALVAANALIGSSCRSADLDEHAVMAVPAPGAEQLRQDFDQAIGYLQAFSVHMDLNARRLGIDYPREFAHLREQIDEATDACAFQALLTRALNLVQDLHVSTMDSAYLIQFGKLQSRFNIDEDERFAAVAAIEQACPAASPSLDLPLMFRDGKYVVYADFSYHGALVKRGTELVSYNGQAIDAFIGSHMDRVWPVRVSAANERYSTRFYRAGDATFRLELSDGRELAMNLADTIELAVPRTHPIYFGSQTQAGVHYFPEQQTLYIGIPMMDEALVDGLTDEIDAVVRGGGHIARIAIDIRGNGGGSDLAWRRVLSHLVGRELQIALDLRMKDSPLARARYKQEPEPAAQPVAELGNADYWLHNGNVVRFAPDAGSLDFKGPIYILRDAYIYSSAANLANFANDEPQLVTVGEPTDLVGGAQIEPLFFKLDHSGLVFRIEPALDFSAVRSLEDFAHNRVEVEIRPSVEDQYLRSTYAGDLYGREFLLEHDPLFRYVLKQPVASDGS